MDTDKLQLWPISIKSNRRSFGPNVDKIYMRFGNGSRWVNRQDGSYRIIGWSFFIGPVRLIFGTKQI